MAKIAYIGTGRRKKSVARVRLLPGSGNITINNTVTQVTSTGGIGVTFGPGSCGTVTIGGEITGSIRVDYTYRPE